MATVKKISQLELTVEELDILRKAKEIFFDIEEEDTDGEIFCQADNYETEWCWLIAFMNNLIENAEIN